MVAAILGSALIAGWQAVARLLEPRPVQALGWVAAAAVIGMLGNEAAARVRIRAGERIGSAALIADGHHARSDALTSLAVLLAAVGSWLGLRYADPVVGLGIALIILRLGVQSGREIVSRMLEGVSPDIIEHMREAAEKVPGVLGVTRDPRSVGRASNPRRRRRDGRPLADDRRVTRRRRRGPPPVAPRGGVRLRGHRARRSLVRPRGGVPRGRQP